MKVLNQVLHYLSMQVKNILIFEFKVRYSALKVFIFGLPILDPKTPDAVKNGNQIKSFNKKPIKISGLD